MAIKPPVIADKYMLLRKLGAGGMAEVFLAKQASEGNFEKLVVIKRILPHLVGGSSNADFLSMFLDEARLASDLRHPNIVTVIDIGKAGDTHFIVMEFLHGQDVRKVQRKNASWGEQIPIAHCCQVAIDAAAGLHYAHTKTDLSGRPLSIVHRDVSPQNIVVTYAGSTKIVDFGIAKAATQSTHTSAGVLKGKYTYMSPEQAAGEPVDARTDQFALGIVLWEMLTMRRLFKRETEMLTLEAIMSGSIPQPSRFRKDLPKSIDDVVMKALSRERHERFANCEEVALALEDALAKESIVHSQSRLAQYMRRLFADALAEEATIGLVNPDGSLTKNFTPFTLPAPERHGADRIDPPKIEPKAAPQDTIEATMADRKSARSREGLRERSEKRDPAPDPRTVVIADNDETEPTVAEEKRSAPAPRAPRSRDRAPAPRDRAIAKRSLIAAGLIAGAALAVVLVLWLALSMWNGSGPATLIVRSEPRGGKVTLDGKDTGQVTPALLRDVEAGTPHKVSVEVPGRGAAHEVVTIPKRGQTFEIKIDLR